MDVVGRFSRYYFGDEMLTRVEVDIQNRQVSMFLTGALLLKPGENSSIFDPELTLAPAVVRFFDCQEMLVSRGSFAMNNTVVEFSAVSVTEDQTAFRCTVTGGWNDDTFLRELTFVARDFAVAEGDTTRVLVD